MQNNPKLKSILIVIFFVLLLILPVTYGLVKSYLAKRVTVQHTEYNDTGTQK
jgi:hypothetical protein